MGWVGVERGCGAYFSSAGARDDDDGRVRGRHSLELPFIEFVHGREGGKEGCVECGVGRG